MKVWLICDDFYHPGIVPIEGLAFLKQTGFEMDVTEDAGDFSVEKMREYPVIIFVKSDNVSSKNQDKWFHEKYQQAFVEYVTKGGGLLVFHSGTAGYKDETVFKNLIGGAFLQHPQQCQVRMEAVKEHPVTDGVDSFTVMDEHYFMALSDEAPEIIFRTISQEGEQPGGWVRSQGDGRVCVLTPGHNLLVWQNENYQKAIENALLWCAKKK